MDHGVQFRDFMLTYNRITANCFNSCVYDMNGRTLNNDEAQCVNNCFWKHLKANNRLMTIFAEFQAKKQEQTRLQQQEQQQALMKVVKADIHTAADAESEPKSDQAAS